MAEFVEFRTEEMIGELEQMERLRLFDKQEIRAITKNRKEFEYKIQRRTKCKEDYLRYIQYEMDLLKLVKLRREKIGTHFQRGDIDFVIANRVNKLFKQAISRFEEDVRLWISYIKFCKQVQFFSCISRMLVRMLTVHNDKPHLWKFASKWEFEQNLSVENARQFLLRGLRHHPDSKLLHTEAFKLELEYTSLVRKQQMEKHAEGGEGSATTKEASSSHAQSSDGQASSSTPVGIQIRPEEITEQVLEGHLAEVLFLAAVKKIHDVVFIISLLTIAKSYDFSTKLQEIIVQHLLQCFPNDELTWDTMARRELEGYRYCTPGTEPPNVTLKGDACSTQSSSSSQSKSSYKTKLKLCFSVYKAAVKDTPTEKMWSLYLDMLLELNQDTVQFPVFKKKQLRAAFKAAHKADKMKEKYYLQWVEMLQNTNKRKTLENVLQTATERLPMSAELWLMRLRFHIGRNDERLVVLVFQDAIARLGSQDESALPLWRMLILYFQMKGPNKVEPIFQESLLQGPAISCILKPQYIEWLALSKGIVSARKAYDGLCLQAPFCLELHMKMVALETMQPEMKWMCIRKCYNVACEQFGKTNADVWMEYIKFELEEGEAKNVSDIYLRAMRNLDAMQTDSFKSEFNLLKTGMSSQKEASV